MTYRNPVLETVNKQKGSENMDKKQVTARLTIMLYSLRLIYKLNERGCNTMYRISGLTLYPMNKDFENNERYHIEVTDEDEQKIYCTGYIFAEVQNNLLQCYQFSVDLMHESGEKLTHEQISDDSRLRSIINAICGILFNNGIGKK